MMDGEAVNGRFQESPFIPVSLRGSPSLAFFVFLFFFFSFWVIKNVLYCVSSQKEKIKKKKKGVWVEVVKNDAVKWGNNRAAG